MPTAAVGAPKEATPSTVSSAADYPPVHNKGLARKLTCAVISVVLVGVCLILLFQVVFTLTAVPKWGEDTKEAMITSEKANLLKLASAKANYVSEIFGRVEEGLLQAQAFAEQVILEVPETMTVNQYLNSFSGLEQGETTWDHSVWFISEFDVGEVPEAASSLEGLLNRTSLMDVLFRGMQRQHFLLYLASLEDPSPATGEVSKVSMQGYAGFDMEAAGYLTINQNEDCDVRFIDYDNGSVTYDPRCRLWYQDAAESGNSEVIFTNPYVDKGTQQLTVTVAAAVYSSSNLELILGVVAIDMDFTDIENSIINMNVIGDSGYAYLLAPGEDGEVAVHRDLLAGDDKQYIVDLEKGVDKIEFGNIVTKMSEECSGSEEYSKGGENWLLSWKHETVSSIGTDEDDDCGNGGFIAVTTVDHSALLEAFSKTESEVRSIVTLASVFMALVLVVIGCITGCIAFLLSTGISVPVNQLVEVVRALNRMDFSQQTVGTWIVNEVSSPEVEELMMAFEAMSTIVKFANITLGSGNVEVAKQNYVEALVLFKKLGNDRGVSIVNNNLGNVYTLEARALATRAADTRSKNKAKKLLDRAQGLYSDAATSFQLAIDDAEMLLMATRGQDEGISSPEPIQAHAESKACEDEAAESENGTPRSISVDVEAGEAAVTGRISDDELTSDAALSLQLANRKFNLALCLAAKGSSIGYGVDSSNLAAIAKARQLMLECTQIPIDRKDIKSTQRHVEYFLELAVLELQQDGRVREAEEALDAAEREIATSQSGVDEGFITSGGLAATSVGGLSPHTLLNVLQQRLLATRGKHCLAADHPERAIEHWTNAVICCGDRMDIGAVRSSLTGLRTLALSGLYTQYFSSKLLKAFRLSPGGAKDTASLTLKIDAALAQLEKRAASTSVGSGVLAKTNVDLCFVMDCTGSMQRWIDQAKNKLVGIIAQAKQDVNNLNLRVAFVGYRDFGDAVQYVGPYDFHSEAEIYKLLTKLKGIKAYGGGDFPEDVTGGLNLATKLSWRSPIRLCILIADAPCHGIAHHGCVGDRFPQGCPKGLKPSELLYTLQYGLGIDFYFIRITPITDRMIQVVQGELSGILKAKKKKRLVLRGTTNTTPKFLIHNLGSDDNRFLEAVVESVKVSAGINLRVEIY